jgi:hypothetical protein
VDEGQALVEISDDQGQGIDFLALPHSALAARADGKAGHLAS